VTPACPLATVLYRFDDAARFPVFESHTTAKGPVTVQADRDDAGSFLRITYQPQAAYGDEVTIVLALPIVAVDGRPQKFLLDVFGDASGCHFYLEGMDASGSPPLLSFGLVDFIGWRTLRADASKLAPPVQFHRLRLTTAPSTHAVRLGVRSLSVTGEVRIATAGIT
jgi:hypothetical protein